MVSRVNVRFGSKAVSGHWRSRVLRARCAPLKGGSQSLQAAREDGGRSPTGCGRLEFGGSRAKSSTRVFRNDEFLGSRTHRTTKCHCTTIPSGRFFGFDHRRGSRSDGKSTPGHLRHWRAGTDGRFSRFKRSAVLQCGNWAQRVGSPGVAQASQGMKKLCGNSWLGTYGSRYAGRSVISHSSGTG